MAHAPFTRILPGCRKTVLLIHGILGTPDHFAFLLDTIPADWNIVNLLLDGHGAGPKEFAATSMKKWKAQVSRQLDNIAIHSDRVVILGHSMGTLFAIQEAIARPNLITQLLLLAVPLRPFVRPATFLASTRLALGLGDKDPLARIMRNDSSVCLPKGILPYLHWLPRFAELLAECSRTCKALPTLGVPCYAFQSRRDELVGMSSARLLEENPVVSVAVLEQSGHFTYGPEDRQQILTRLRQILA